MRKKLFAILMSAMMMVTFMPAMAFAATTPTIEQGFTGEFYPEYKVSYGTDSVVLPTTRTWNNGGWVTATVTDETINTELHNHPSMEEHIASALRTLKNSNPTVDFYDLTGSTILHDVSWTGGLHAYPLPATAEWADAQTFFETDANGVVTLENPGIKVVAPAYVGAANAGKTAVLDASNTFSGWTKQFVVTGWKATEKAAQTATVTVKWTTTPSTRTVKFGTVAPATIAVAAKKLSARDIAFYVDDTNGTAICNTAGIVGTEKNDNACVVYDGAAHKIVTNAVDGVTVKYSKFNTTTGEFDAIDAIEWKDAAEATLYKAVIKDAKETLTVYLTATVEKAKFTVNLKDDCIFEGTDIDAWNYVELLGVKKNHDWSGTVNNSKAAVKADKDAIIAALKTVADATATKCNDAYTAYRDGFAVVAKYDLKLAAKTGLTTAQTEAFKKALANYDVADLALNDEADLYVVAGVRANEIEFVQAPSVKKYHNKKGVLKKNYTFTVKAEATSGVAPTYKLINGNSKIVIDKTTGKITVKKGLKKGTYTVKVKAYGAAGNGYAAASETQTIKIVLTK